MPAPALRNGFLLSCQFFPVDCNHVSHRIKKIKIKKYRKCTTGYVIPFFLMLLTGAGAGAGVEEFAVEADMVKTQVTTDEKKTTVCKR